MKQFLKLGCALFVAGFGCIGQARAEQPSEPAPTQQELLRELRSLRSEVRELRGKLEARQATTQPSQGPATPDQARAAADLEKDAERSSSLSEVDGLTAGYARDKGFFIRSDDGAFLLHPWAFIQARNATNYRETSTTGGSDTQNGFEVPRMKFILDGNVFTPDLTYQFIWATSDTTGNLGLQDAWARYHIPETPFALRAGQIRNPVDHEQLMFATRSLTPERSLVNNILLNGDDIVKGASIGYGYDTNSPLRTEVAITSGQRNFDTNFQPFPTNPASWGAAGRLEYKVMGAWADYAQFTALNDKDPLLVLGGGFDYTEAGDAAALTHVADVQFDLPARLSLYGAYLGRYTRHNAGPPTTNGGATGTAAIANTYDSTVRLMAGYLIDAHWEPFVRYEYLHFDGRELPGGTDGNVHDLTAGFNYYFYGHRAKITTGITWLPTGSPVANTLGDLLASHKGNEVIVQAQFQLIL